MNLTDLPDNTVMLVTRGDPAEEPTGAIQAYLVTPQGVWHQIGWTVLGQDETLFLAAMRAFADRHLYAIQNEVGMDI
jgi:hypothetical protein